MGLKKVVVFYFLLCSALAFAQNNKPLFSSDSVLNLTLKLSIDDLINDREIRNDHKAILTFQSEKGLTHNVKLKVRGKNRAKYETCGFPPLTLDLKKNEVANSIFAGQNKLKLVTHCRDNKNFQDYIFKEYLVYKLYQEISPQSFGVRLCEITYEDIKDSSYKITKYGFLIEDIDDVAHRNQKIECDDKIANQQACSNIELEKLTFFQFMIGNLDWSIPHRHNIKLIVNQNGSLPVPIPYDFDASGFVNTPYAKPPPQSNAISVRSRVFWGLCRPKSGYDDTVSFFKSKKERLLSIVSSFERLSEKSKKSTLKYLESFYDILNNDKQLNKKIVEACRMDHKHLFEN